MAIQSLLMAIQSLLMCIQSLLMCIQSLQTEIFTGFFFILIRFG